MKKSDLINFLAKGGTVEAAARRLDFAHRNSLQRLPAELTERQTKDMIRRMKAKRIKYPADWGAPK